MVVRYNRCMSFNQEKALAKNEKGEEDKESADLVVFLKGLQDSRKEL